MGKLPGSPGEAPGGVLATNKRIDNSVSFFDGGSTKKVEGVQDPIAQPRATRIETRVPPPETPEALKQIAYVLLPYDQGLQVGEIIRR